MLKPLTVTCRRYTRAGLLALSAALLASALLVAKAGAHALLLGSEPETGAVLEDSPEHVAAWFSEELDSGLSSMRVFDAEGRQVDGGDGGVDLNDLDHTSMVASLPPSLPAGTYTVRWAVVSADDDDMTEGEFSFSVGGGPTLEEPIGSTAHAGSSWFIGGITAVGFGLLLLAPFIVVRRRGLAPREE